MCTSGCYILAIYVELAPRIGVTVFYRPLRWILRLDPEAVYFCPGS